MDCFYCCCTEAFLPKTFPRYRLKSLHWFFSILLNSTDLSCFVPNILVFTTSTLSKKNYKHYGFCISLQIIALFYDPNFIADWLQMPGSLILLLVVAPNFFAHTLKDGWVGVLICLLIGCYLLQEHIRASGGFRNSFTQSHGISNTLGIILLLVYPVWALVLHFI